MHKEEADWLLSELTKYYNDISSILNIGSSTLDFRTTKQPHIDANLFAPLNEMGIPVIHNDLKDDIGVDLVGDISSEENKSIIHKANVNCVICSNLLEHVESVNLMANSIVSLLPVGGLIFVTVPYKYPLHFDPIDNGYRPSPAFLNETFINTEMVSQSVLQVGKSYRRYFSNPLLLLKSICRLLLPFYKYRGWKTNAYSLLWAFREKSVTCAVLRKTEQV